MTLYGQENHAVLFWDDGHEKNTYVVDNNYESSRFGFKGNAKTGFGDWAAGYRLEVEPTGANSAKLNQFDDDNANDSAGPLNVRHSFIYLSSKTYGEGRMGLTATPIYNITKDTNVTELEDTTHSDNRMMQGFFLRSKGFDNAEGLSKLKWQNISSCYDSANAFVCGTRKNGVAYCSPELAGFSASIGYFEDDEWGAALRYKRNGARHSMSAPASATPRIPTSATNLAAAAMPMGQTRLSPRRTISGTSSATSRIGRGLPPSSISQPAYLPSAPSASRRRTTPTPSIQASTPAPALPK